MPRRLSAIANSLIGLLDVAAIMADRLPFIFQIELEPHEGSSASVSIDRVRSETT
jgi:hypothetical protein